MFCKTTLGMQSRKKILYIPLIIRIIYYGIAFIYSHYFVRGLIASKDMSTLHQKDHKKVV